MSIKNAPEYFENDKEKKDVERTIKMILMGGTPKNETKHFVKLGMTP